MRYTCLHCEKPFSAPPSQKRKFCRTVCQQDYQNTQAVIAGTCSTRQLRRWLLRHRPYKCSCCGISRWLGKKLTLQLDHINGDGDDNRLANVRWLCPNCHTQTKTWGVQNVKDRRSLATRHRRNKRTRRVIDEFLD